jgi:predicted nucleic acid-binding protein
MTYLADSNLICEPTKSQASPEALLWLKEQSLNLVIDAVVLGEIWDGITALPDGRKRRDLEDWFSRLRASVTVLSWTDDTAVVWGDLRQEESNPKTCFPGLLFSQPSSCRKIPGLSVGLAGGASSSKNGIFLGQSGRNAFAFAVWIPGWYRSIL